MIAMIGTSDRWLAEACKIPSLEDVWMYGLEPYYAALTPS